MRRPSRARPGMSALRDDRCLQALEGDLAVGDLLEGDSERLGSHPALDERRDELSPALTELAVVGVDLPGPLGSEDDQGVARIDVREELVDLGFDHCGIPSLRTGPCRAPNELGVGAVRIDYTGDPPRRLRSVVVHHLMVEPGRLAHLPVGGGQAPLELALALRPPLAAPPTEPLPR